MLGVSVHGDRGHAATTTIDATLPTSSITNDHCIICDIHIPKHACHPLDPFHIAQMRTLTLINMIAKD